MHIGARAKAMMFLAAMFFVAGISSQAQSGTQREAASRPELAVEYNYVHSNAPPGECGCINLNGGSANFAWPLHHWQLSLVGDVGAVHAGSITNQGYDLTLSTYTAGLRYSPRLRRWHLRPWAQLLIGGAHASGSLVEGSGSSTGGGAFASLVGGGVDVRMSPRFSIRAFEAEYLVTTFNNGGNDHQNNLRIGAGVVFHF
jgi:outer membrane immunogenic protein